MEQTELTPSQIENWRKMLVKSFGPYALIMPVADIQLARDRMQKAFDNIPIDEDHDDVQ